jgi:hypothetical protein
MSDRLPPDLKLYWTGKIDKCDLCKAPIDRFFVDGRTKMGPWAIMCPGCHRDQGLGLGMGKGQKYQKEFPSEEFYKIEG